MSVSPKVVVIGGGITGAFATYFLARAGVPVTMIERGAVGSEASGKNAGGLTPLFGARIPGPLAGLARRAFDLHLQNWEAIERLSGRGFGGRINKRLDIAVDEQDVQGLQALEARYEEADGFAARWLDRQEALGLEPRLGENVIRALLAEGDAHVDGGRYTRAVAAAARTLGADLIFDEVLDIDARGSRVVDVRTTRARIECDALVVATGPWSRHATKWLNTPIPVEPVKGEMLLVEAAGVAIDMAWRNAGVYGADGAHLWLGGTDERVGFDQIPSEEGRRSILGRVERFLPILRGSRVVAHTAGLRPSTPDDLPILGIPSSWKNVCIATGGGRKGMLLGSALGLGAAQLVTEGSTDLPVAGCMPDRFPRTIPTSGSTRE